MENNDIDNETLVPSPGMQALNESEQAAFEHTESAMLELDDRTYLRSLALQALYEMDLAEHSLELALSNRWESVELENIRKAVVHKLVKGVAEHQSEIDSYIVKHAPDWPLDQIAVVDRNIMRIAIFEFRIEKSTPKEVAINEAVELAKMFCLDSSPRFINAVLHAVADDSGL